ncbi:MAG: hypothetical protein NDJ18_06540 [candidate division Zixibacteria bacterium]|nr:hypothetical protein [candidate division Zixibacteria bacterium]
MKRATFRPVLACMIGLLLVSCQGNADSNRNSPLSPDQNIIASVVGDARLRIPEFPSGPDGFVGGITNPYLMYTPGNKFTYGAQTDEGAERIVIDVLSDTKTILGVATTVVHDQVFLNDTLIEDTYDWYAQDSSGNVWYFGEDTKEYENGVVVSTEGSWEAGVGGAVSGIAMLAVPRIGLSYHQEFAEDVAEDMAQVVGPPATTVEIPFGRFENAIRIMEWTPLDHSVREFKYYVSGVGMVLEVSPRSGVRVELMTID